MQSFHGAGDECVKTSAAAGGIGDWQTAPAGEQAAAAVCPDGRGFGHGCHRFVVRDSFPTKADAHIVIHNTWM
jgi:hypothetical protein